MADVKSLQEMLNERADARLKSEVDAAFEGWKKFQYVKCDSLRIVIGNAEPIYLGGHDGLIEQLKRQVIEKHREAYREAESSMFLADVESFRRSLNDLAAGGIEGE